MIDPPGPLPLQGRRLNASVGEDSTNDRRHHDAISDDVDRVAAGRDAGTSRGRSDVRVVLDVVSLVGVALREPDSSITRDSRAGLDRIALLGEDLDQDARGG